MSKSKGVELPPTPTYQEEPLFRQGFTNLSDLGNKLTSFDFSGNLSPLQDTVNYDPEITRLALQQATGTLGPQFEELTRNTRNEAAANNQLESSTFTDALARNQQNYQSQLLGITAGAALEDRSRALQNRIGLFGTGLNSLQTGATLAGQSQDQQNQFNLANYQNEVARVLAGQAPANGGLMGALTGGAGGLALGAALAPFTGGASLFLGAGLGAAAGGLGPQGTGGQILGAGAGAYGGSMGGSFGRTPTGLPSIFPGSAAYNPLKGALGSSDNSGILNLLQMQQGGWN